jgi:DNA replication protein DnaC
MDEWLVIHGPVGSGKSHLAAAVRNHLTRVLGVPTLFLTTPELLSSLREEVGASDERRGTPKALKTACDAPVLILDDLGAERLTPFAEEQLFLLLDARYRRRWPTLVITNLPLKELPPRIGSRLADRVLCRVVLNPAADYRWGDGGVSG